MADVGVGEQDPGRRRTSAVGEHRVDAALQRVHLARPARGLVAGGDDAKRSRPSAELPRRSAATSAVPSVDPSSIRITSKSGYSCTRSEGKVSGSIAASSRAGTSTATRGAAAGAVLGSATFLRK